MNKKTVVVVPTYNEKDNVVKLIDEINSLNLSLDILFVDDNSPDGTGGIIESIKKTKPNVNIIHREKKEGLGPAYIEAFRHILEKTGYEQVIQMDADFSHNPVDIPRLIEVVKQCDAAIGSRYIKGGGVSDKWNILRKLISKFGNFYARLITGLKIHDCTGGFRCYRRKTLEALDFSKDFLNGYGFQIQMAHELKKNNFDMHEVPIFFGERAKGYSKMNLHIIIEAFFSLISMRLKYIFKR